MMPTTSEPSALADQWAGTVCARCLKDRCKCVTVVGTIRTFDTGATRNALGNKLQYEGYFSPLVLKARAEYMRRHQVQEDGSVRAADNWQLGIPRDALMDSAFRHFMDWWMSHRGHAAPEARIEAICALMFNAEAYLNALLIDETKG